jgi:hypothetical protein
MFAAKSVLQTTSPRPAFDAVGAGYQSGSSSNITSTETHVLGASATAILAFFGFGCNSAPTTFTCKVGGSSGTPMTLLASKQQGTNFVYVFGLIGPPTGSQSISGHIQASASIYVSTNTVSYKNVSAFGTPNTNSAASGTTASNSVPWSPGAVWVQGMENSASPGATFSSPTCTSRYSIGGAFNSGQPLFIGDTASLTTSGSILQATLGSAAWEAIAVPLFS